MTFEIDANGILHVSARDKDTGKEQSITITETGNLDPSEIERMIAEAESQRAEDATLRQKVDARNELDSAVYRVERRLAELGDTVPVHVKARADGLVSDARAALDEDAPFERIRALTDELQQVYHSLGSGQPDTDAGVGSTVGPR